jgi:hypothetical protein
VAARSPDGSRVASSPANCAADIVLRSSSRNAHYELAFSSVLPSFNPSGDESVMVGRPEGPTPLGSSIQIDRPAWTQPGRLQGQHATCLDRSGLRRQDHPVPHRHLPGFFNGFVSRIMSHDDRIEGGAQIAIINPEGGGFGRSPAASTTTGSVDVARQQAHRLSTLPPMAKAFAS